MNPVNIICVMNVLKQRNKSGFLIAKHVSQSPLSKMSKMCKQIQPMKIVVTLVVAMGYLALLQWLER